MPYAFASVRDFQRAAQSIEKTERTDFEYRENITLIKATLRTEEKYSEDGRYRYAKVVWYDPGQDKYNDAGAQRVLVRYHERNEPPPEGVIVEGALAGSLNGLAVYMTFEVPEAASGIYGLSGPYGVTGGPYNTVCWYSTFIIDGQCRLVRYCLTGRDLTLGMQIMNP